MSENISPIREARLRQAYDCVVASGGAGASVNEVAACLKIKPAPYLRDMLEDMRGYGWLRREQVMLETGRGLRMGWKYYVVPQDGQNG